MLWRQSERRISRGRAWTKRDAVQRAARGVGDHTTYVEVRLITYPNDTPGLFGVRVATRTVWTTSL